MRLLKVILCILDNEFLKKSVADPGFCRRGNANPKVGAPINYFGHFVTKLHETEKNLA